MPVFLAPGYLLAAVLASAVVVALHLLAWRRPEPTPLPTARFAPPSAVRAVSRALRLSDVWLLLVRVLALLLAGLALARPTMHPRRAGVARILLLDASRRVGSMDAVRDSARARAAGADATVWVRVDTTAHVLPDSVVGARADVRGHLSAGLVLAVQAAHRLAATHARVEVVVVSPFAAESWDAATEATRRAWPGAVQAVRVVAREDVGAAAGTSPSGASRTTTRPDRDLPPVDDPVGAAFALAVDSTLASIRVRRDRASAADSAWARQGGVLVWWPRAGAGDARAARGPSVVMLGDGIRSAAGHFVALPGVALPGRAILRWADGTIAAAEESLGNGCLRRVAVGVPDAGDEVLRPGFVRLVRGLGAACGGGGAALVDDETIASWAHAAPTSSESVSGATFGSGAGASEVTFAPPRPSPTLARWLLAAVALALLIEWWLRRHLAFEAARDESRAPASRVAA